MFGNVAKILSKWENQGENLKNSSEHGQRN
jgi:hypothetical protein